MNKIKLDHNDIAILDSDTYTMAEVLMNMAKENHESADYDLTESGIETALYSLKNMANNPYEVDCYRHLFTALSLIVDTNY